MESWPYILVGIATGALGLVLVSWLVRRATREPPAAAPPDRRELAKSAAHAAARRTRQPSGTEPPIPQPHALILASEVHAEQLRQVDGASWITVKDAEALASAAARHPSAIAFVDVDQLPALEGKLAHTPLVAIADVAGADALATIVGLLDRHRSVTHVVAAPLLSQPLGRTHVDGLLQRLAKVREHDLLSAASIGRVAMLATATQREARFERMQEYFSKHGVSSRTTLAIYDVAEELVMNALYNAPSEAGYFKTPVSRAENVSLPLDRACEISYGIENGVAFVRLRDPFGALRHERLLEVLHRCNKDGIVLDESRGGAGLGMWRVFSAATTIAITVIPGRLTDILVRIAPKSARSAKQLLAVDLYFLSESQAATQPLLDQDDNLLDQSITLIQER